MWISSGVYGLMREREREKAVVICNDFDSESSIKWKKGNVHVDWFKGQYTK